MLSWIHVLDWRATTTPDAPALSDHLGGELTYRELATAVERAAGHYAAAGVPIALYGAGPRTIEDANAHRANERLKLDDLYKATEIVALAVRDLLAE